MDAARTELTMVTIEHERFLARFENCGHLRRYRIECDSVSATLLNAIEKDSMALPPDLLIRWPSMVLLIVLASISSASIVAPAGKFCNVSSRTSTNGAYLAIATDRVTVFSRNYGMLLQKPCSGRL